MFQLTQREWKYGKSAEVKRVNLLRTRNSRNSVMGASMSLAGWQGGFGGDERGYDWL